MPTLLQINSVANTGSTGRIAEGIGQAAIKAGWKSYIAYGRYANPSQSELIKIGNKWDIWNHVLQTRLFDKHGLASKGATKKLIQRIEQIKPNIIHLHNIHGYYMNYPILFEYLSKNNIPVVWTLHDCWPFTGHCAYFSYLGCEKWKLQCKHCPNLKEYPTSFGLDNSNTNYKSRKKYFTLIHNLTLVPVSDWLENLVHQSFLKKCYSQRIYNGVDTAIFHPMPMSNSILNKYSIPNSNFVLGVANVWEKRKGLQDFIQLRKILPTSYSIVLVGLNSRQIAELPNGIIGIQRTENVEQLRNLYTSALAFVNPTWEDNFPTTNLEALACGTPVITYQTGGSPEAISPETGFVVEQGDIQGMVNAIKKICQEGKETYSKACRDRAVRYFNKEERFQEYIDLYNQILSK